MLLGFGERRIKPLQSACHNGIHLIVGFNHANGHGGIGSFSDGVARGRQRGTAAALLGVATGISLAGMATLIKACTNLLVQGPVTLMTSWQLYAPLAIGAVGWLPNQLAFQAGPLSESLPPSPWSIQSSRRILIGDWWACRMAAAAARPRRRGP